jgi:hypothetical protein
MLARVLVKFFYKKSYAKTFLLEDINDEEYREYISKFMNRTWDT